MFLGNGGGNGKNEKDHSSSDGVPDRLQRDTPEKWSQIGVKDDDTTYCKRPRPIIKTFLDRMNA